MNEHQLRVRMEALGAGPATADWADARGRAVRLRRRRTKLLVAVAAAASVVAVPAFALATGELDFWSAERAAPRVELVFREMDRHRPADVPAFDIREARKVLTRTFPSGLLTEGRWTLSVGLRQDGEFCTFIQGPRGGGGGCSERHGELSVSGSMVDKLSDGVVYGSVDHPEAAYVEIVFRGDRVKRAELTWVSEPIGAAFFMEQVPVWGQLGTVVVRDADGARLVSSQF